MPKTAADVEPRASARQIRRARHQLEELAARLALSDLRIMEDGTLLLHVDQDPSYRPVLKFIAEATRILGAEPHVITDDAPIAGSLQTNPL